MYQTIEAFVQDWRRESVATLRVLRKLTDDSLSQKVSADGRSLGFIAWHIVLTMSEMGSSAGLPVAGPAEDSPPPAHAAQITSAYESTSQSLTEQVRALWTDAMLKDELSMYGSIWKKDAVLESLVRHQIHHRGQMTILMRQAGLTVPGVYGPAREEWAGMGRPPQP